MSAKEFVLRQVRKYENESRFDEWAGSSALMISICKPIYVFGSTWSAIRELLDEEQICYDGKKLIRLKAI